MEEQPPEEVDDAKYFKILDSSVKGDDNQSCVITVLGYVGSENPDNASVSRRLSVEIDGEWIENAGNFENDEFFSDLDDKWKNCNGQNGQADECSNDECGYVVWSDGNHLTSSANHPIESYGQYFYIAVDESEGTLESISLDIKDKGKPRNSTCDPAEDCKVTNNDISIYKLDFGQQVQTADKNIQLWIEADGTITITQGTLTDNENPPDNFGGECPQSQNPIDEGTWQEG